MPSRFTGTHARTTPPQLDDVADDVTRLVHLPQNTLGGRRPFPHRQDHSDPRVEVRRQSSSGTSPMSRSILKIGGTGRTDLDSGRQRLRQHAWRVVGMPPPVMWAAPFSTRAAISARMGFR
jgi:hypothetical protein